MDASDGTPAPEMFSEEWCTHHFDNLSPHLGEGLHPALGYLREHCPVAHSDRWGGFWTLTRYRDIVRAAGDARTFVSSVQNLVPPSPRNGLPRRPLASDPPEHTLFRRVLNQHLSEARVARLDEAAQIARAIGR